MKSQMHSLWGLSRYMFTVLVCRSWIIVRRKNQCKKRSHVSTKSGTGRQAQWRLLSVLFVRNVKSTTKCRKQILYTKKSNITECGGNGVMRIQKDSLENDLPHQSQRLFHSGVAGTRDLRGSHQILYRTP